MHWAENGQGLVSLLCLVIILKLFHESVSLTQKLLQMPTAQQQIPVSKLPTCGRCTLEEKCK
jgi:hypothetical protein